MKKKSYCLMQRGNVHNWYFTPLFGFSPDADQAMLFPSIDMAELVWHQHKHNWGTWNIVAVRMT